MFYELHNYAYIDGANFHNGTLELGWQVNYKRFRVWLREKYDVEKAFIFLGFIPKNINIYRNLEKTGFTLVFKEVSYDKNQRIKGNCDAELILKAISDYYEFAFASAVIISSDGDFACLVNFLSERGALATLISPRNSCSILLLKLNTHLVYLETQRSLLELVQEETDENEKALGKDGTSQRSFS